jgi:hypothetical protein
MIPHEIKVDNQKEIIDFNLLEYVYREEGYSSEDLELLENLRDAYHGALCAPTDFGFWTFKNPLYVSKTQTDLCKYPGEYNMYISEDVKPYNRDENDVHFFLEISGTPTPNGYFVKENYNENLVEPFKTINQKFLDINKTSVGYQFLSEMTFRDKLIAASDAYSLVFVDTPTGTHFLYVDHPVFASIETRDYSLADRQHLSVLSFNPPMLIIFVFMGFVAISLIVWTMIRIPKTKTRCNISKKEQ